MPAPNDPRPTGPPAAKPPVLATPVSPQRFAKAPPESTLTLMIESGQAPGALTPTQAVQDSASKKRPHLLGRAWAAIKGWF